MKNLRKKLTSWIDGAVESIENAPLTFRGWTITFLSIIILRVAVDNLVLGFPSQSSLVLFFEFSHTFTFFLLSYLLLVWLITRILKTDIQKTANVLLFGFLIILTPPLTDYWVSGGEGYWSFYIFDSLSGLAVRFLTFFGDNPDVGITYGVRVEVFFAIIFLMLYALKTTGKKSKMWMTGLLSYITFFVLGTFPSYITILFEGFDRGFLSVSSSTIAGMFLSPAKFFYRDFPELISALGIKMTLIYSLILVGVCSVWLYRNKREKTMSFVHNFRWPQVVYHCGLFTLGIVLSLAFNKLSFDFNFFNVLAYFSLMLAVVFAWLASVVVNDLYDLRIDAVTNSSRPLVSGHFSVDEYKALGGVLFFASIFLAMIVSFKVATFLICYQAIAWAYSAWPLRLKRIAFVSTFVSALASIMILFVGYITVSKNQLIASLPDGIVWLLLIGFTFALSLKDFKDIEGDKKDGVYTLPVVFGEDWARIIVAGGIFFSFMLSVVVINDSRLYIWAVIFGAVAFWIMLNKKIHPRNIFWWMLLIVTVYGGVLALVLW